MLMYGQNPDLDNGSYLGCTLELLGDVFLNNADFRKQVFTSSSFSIVLAEGLSHVAFILYFF